MEEESSKLYKPESNYNKNVEYPKVRLISWDESGITLRSWIWGKDSSDAFENLSEGLQQTMRGEQMEDNISEMEEAIDKIEEILDNIDNVQ